MGQTAYLGVVLLVLLLQDDVPYDVPCNGGTGFGVQFQHFFQAFSLEMTDDNMLSLSTLGARSRSVIFVNGWTTENTLEM
jgi:hypothetical protein